MFTVPNVSVFKAYFNRDFNYAPASDPDNLSFITDDDITKAYAQADASVFEKEINYPLPFIDGCYPFWRVFLIKAQKEESSKKGTNPMSCKRLLIFRKL